MSLSHRYRQLAAFIEALESNGITVRDAEPVRKGTEPESSDESFSVQLCVELPADASVSRLGLEHVGGAKASGGLSSGPIGVHASAPVEARTEDGRDRREDANATEATEVTGTTETIGTTETVADTRATDDTEDAASVAAEHTDASNATPTDDETSADVAHAEDETTGDDTPAGEAGVPCTHSGCDRTFTTERGMKIHRTKAHPLSELVDQTDDRTVHHDPEVLARVYDEYETFAEMTEALDVDVGAQAVRKQMIRHDIHEPGGSASGRAESDSQSRSDADVSRDGGDSRSDGGDASGADDPASERTGSDESRDTADESAQTDSRSRTGAGPDDASSASETDTAIGSEAIADRLPELDLPASLSTRDLQTAVEEATTLFDVQRALGLDQRTTRDVLSEYDLLELVSGRAASHRDREELKDEIGQRIRRTAT